MHQAVDICMHVGTYNIEWRSGGVKRWRVEGWSEGGKREEGVGSE